MKLLLLLACLTGCADIALHAAIVRGQERIYQASGILVVPRVAGMVRGRFQCGIDQPSTFLGCAIPPRGIILISTDAAPILEQVVVHELMHLAGCPHVPAGQGIMAASTSSQLSLISYVDLKALCAVATCQWERPEL